MRRKEDVSEPWSKSNGLPKEFGQVFCKLVTLIRTHRTLRACEANNFRALMRKCWVVPHSDDLFSLVQIKVAPFSFGFKILASVWGRSECFSIWDPRGAWSMLTHSLHGRPTYFSLVDAYACAPLLLPLSQMCHLMWKTLSRNDVKKESRLQVWVSWQSVQKPPKKRGGRETRLHRKRSGVRWTELANLSAESPSLHPHHSLFWE